MTPKQERYWAYDMAIRPAPDNTTPIWDWFELVPVPDPYAMRLKRRRLRKEAQRARRKERKK